MATLKHDTSIIGTTHPNGDRREVAAFVEAGMYARGDFRELLRAVRTNRDLKEAIFYIDEPRRDGADERHLTFGQLVTIDEIQSIVEREDAAERAAFEASFFGDGA